MKLKINHIWLFLSLIIITFIFSNSLKTAAVSTDQSNVILNFLCSLFNITAKSSIDTLFYIVRKTAHIAEFAAFSFCLSMYFTTCGKKFSEFFIYVLFFGLLAACTDEFLQLFATGRSSEVKDVFIDFFGVGIGALFSVFVKKIMQKNKRGCCK